MQQRLYVTPAGLARLHSDLELRLSELREICAARDEAFELSGDGWHDNPHFNKMQQDEVAKNRQIAELRSQIQGAVLFAAEDGRRPSKRLALGAIALLAVRETGQPVRERLVEIVAYGESDPSRGRFAYNTPVARALLGLEPGDECEGPDGRSQMELVELLQRWPEASKGDAWVS